MKTKVIPFDLELAKKIQAGEIEGSIKTRCGEKVRILCTDVRSDYPIVAVVSLDNEKEEVRTYNANCSYIDRGSCHPTEDSRDIVLEVPDDEPQFEPFDKVLVRDFDNQEWRCALFSHKSGYEYFASSFSWAQCIPIEGNQELAGTTNKPKEE